MSCKSRKRKHHSGTILIRFCRLLKCNLNYKAPKTNKPLGMYLTPKHIMYLATNKGIESIISFFQLNRAIWSYSTPIAILNISKESTTQCREVPKITEIYKNFYCFQNRRTTRMQQQECSNYRHLSFLPNVSKHTEKLIHLRQYLFLHSGCFLFLY